MSRSQRVWFGERVSIHPGILPSLLPAASILCAGLHLPALPLNWWNSGAGSFQLKPLMFKKLILFWYRERKRKLDLWNVPSLKKEAGNWLAAWLELVSASCTCNWNNSTFQKSLNGLLSVGTVHRHYKTCNYFYCRAIKYRSVKVWVQNTRTSYSSDQPRWKSIINDENKVLENPLGLFVPTCNDSLCNHIKSKHLWDFITNFFHRYRKLI